MNFKLTILAEICPKLFSLLLFISIYSKTNACSSRTMMKPKPTPPTTPITTTPRPNITFPIYNCPATYAAWYCLNDAVCFAVEIQNEILYNCQCTNGFMGPRCEYKEIDGSYLPTRRRAMLEKASIASGAFLALFVMFIVCLSCYVQHAKDPKTLNENSTMGHENGGMDEVDGIMPVTKKRPFGPHHYHKLSLAAAIRQQQQQDQNTK